MPPHILSLQFRTHQSPQQHPAFHPFCCRTHICSNRFPFSSLTSLSYTLISIRASAGTLKKGPRTFPTNWSDRPQFHGFSIETRPPIQESSRLQLNFSEDLRSTTDLIYRSRAPRQQPGLHHRSEVCLPLIFLDLTFDCFRTYFCLVENILSFGWNL